VVWIKVYSLAETEAIDRTITVISVIDKLLERLFMGKSSFPLPGFLEYPRMLR
jgi:hypothetical protein